MSREQPEHQNFFTTKLEVMANWARKNSLWPMPFGTACCAIEYMSVISSTYDVARFGAEVLRFSPRQADLLMVMGTITDKMGPVLKRIYDQMPEPKWVISMGACATSGGFYRSYHVMQGIDEIIPVDVYIEAAESPDKSVEKYASRFEIDMMRCIYCGFCVDACPEEAIIMSRQSELATYTRPETVWGIDKLMRRSELPEYGPGYRPNYPPQYPLLESQLPFRLEKRGSGDEVHPAQTVRDGAELIPGGPVDLKKESYLRTGNQEFNEAPLVELPPLEAQGQRGSIADLERERMVHHRKK